MTAAPLIDDMNLFFAQEYQRLADDIAREPVITAQMAEDRRKCLAKAEWHRERMGRNA